jgi:hypothetical protein
VTVVTTKPDHIATIERVQGILARSDAGLAELQGCERDLKHVLGAAKNDLEEIGSRRKIEMTAATPAGQLDRKLDELDKREREVGRRLEIGQAVLAQLVAKIDDAIEAERSAKRQANYDEALALHVAATIRVRTFLDKVAPEAAEVLRAYAESEAATSAANKDLPAGTMRLPTIENERMGSHPPARITERRVQWFVHNGNRIAEVGRCEAYPHQNGNGLWTIYRRSNAIQGDETIGPCTIVDLVEETIQKYEPRPLEALSTSLRIPAFDAPAPALGRAEIRLMPASPVLALAAE